MWFHRARRVDTTSPKGSGETGEDRRENSETEEKEEKEEKEKRNKRRIERWYIATRIVEVTCYAIVYEYTSKAYTV